MKADFPRPPRSEGLRSHDCGVVGGGKQPYLQSPPVLGAVGGDDDAVLPGRPEPQRQSEVLAVLVHPVQEPQVGLPVETHGRLCQA